MFSGLSLKKLFVTKRSLTRKTQTRYHAQPTIFLSSRLQIFIRQTIAWRFSPAHRTCLNLDLPRARSIDSSAVQFNLFFDNVYQNRAFINHIS